MTDQAERLPISLPDSVGEITASERHELECLRAQIKQIAYPCSPHCAGYLRELETRSAMHRVREETIESGDWVPMPKNADQAVAMWLIGEAWVRANAPDRLSPLPTPPQKDLESR